MRLPFGKTGKASAPPPEVADLAREHGSALAWGRTRDGALVIAVPDALVVSSGDASQVLPWHAIDVGTWRPPEFVIRYRDLASGASRRLRLPMAEAGELPPVLRDQVNRTVLVTRRVQLLGDLGAVMAARSDPSGEISWTVVFDPGIDVRDPQLQAVARESLAELRRSLGV